MLNLEMQLVEAWDFKSFGWMKGIESLQET